MQITVRLFAQLREQFGAAAVSLTLPEAADIETLTQALLAHFSDLPEDVRQQLQADNVRIAVNQQLIEGHTPLATGDEVAFLPPVTGG